MIPSKLFFSAFCSIVVLIQMISPGCSNEVPNDITCQIFEEQPVDAFVINLAEKTRPMINLTDQEFSQLTYQLLNKANAETKLFSLNEGTGRLVTNARIDREAVCPDQVVCVLQLDVAIYKGTEPLKFIKVGVEIIDINDHAPFFNDLEVTLTISESIPDRYVVLTNAATDLDTGANNSIQSYSFVIPQDMFKLIVQNDVHGTPTLGIEVLKPLDYEKEKFYILEVIATDGGFPQKTGTVTITLNVTDENDNGPIFKEPNYTLLIPENPPKGQVLLKVSASDADSGDLGLVGYRFSPQYEKVSTLLKINETTGEIVVDGVVDYEVDKRFVFPVIAFDHGQMPKSSQVMVYINISDVNDNAPMININLPPGGDRISEKVPVDQYIANLAVSDPDSGNNGIVSCSLFNTEYFQLQELIGFSEIYKITLKKSLDRETQEIHNVTVICEDKGSPPQRNQTSFLITVSDINDNYPQFTHKFFNFSINENNAVGDSIGVITAEDPDAGQNGEITFSLVNVTHNEIDIDPKTGALLAKVTFDREAKSSISLQVIATDGGTEKFSAVVSVVVHILDKNDNPPKFSDLLYKFSISENQAPGTIVGGLKVTDDDIGLNGRIIFTESHNFTHLFSVDNNGYIRTVAVLDRETRSIYDFMIIARDQGDPSFQATASVSIVIEDMNDNVPYVMFPTNSNNSVNIALTKPKGAIITQVLASDPDEGANSKLSYKVKKGNEAGLFKLDNRTGVVTLMVTLNEDNMGTYTLLVAVEDSGVPPQTSWSNLVIVVGNEDGNRNLIIAIALSAVTLTLSAAMVIIIFVIRRQDALRERENQSNYRDHKKLFILQWLECLSSSSKSMQKLASERQENKPAPVTDLKPIITLTSRGSTSSDGSHDNNKVSRKNDDDEGFIETMGGTLGSHDSGRGDSIRDRHPSGNSQDHSHDTVFSTFGRKPVSSFSETGSDMRYSDSVSIPESWNNRPQNVRFNRVVSFDDEILHGKPYRSFTSFRDEAEHPVSTVTDSNLNCGFSYDSQTLHRHLKKNPTNHQRPLHSNIKKANRVMLPPIASIPENSEHRMETKTPNLLRSHSETPYYSPSQKSSSHSCDIPPTLHFHPGHSQMDRQSQSSCGTTQCNYAINPPNLERAIEERLNQTTDCIV